MLAVKAILNHVIFQFEDVITHKTNVGRQTKQFEDTTEWGFTMSNFDDSTKTPRWGIVISVGKDTDPEIQVRSRVLISPLQWTEAIDVDGRNYWRTDDTNILAFDVDFQDII